MSRRLFILINSYGNAFAVDAFDIHTILPFSAFSASENPECGVCGFVEYGGEKIPSVDFMKVSALRGIRNLFSSRCILLKSGEKYGLGLVGLLAEGVTRSAEIESDAVEDFPWSAGNLKLSRAFEFEGEMFKIIEPCELLAAFAPDLKNAVVQAQQTRKEK